MTRPGIVKSINARKKVLIPLLIIVFGVIIFISLIVSKPDTSRSSIKDFSRLVEVYPVTKTTIQISIESTGIIRPRREITLQPRVTGEIKNVSDKLVPGGFFEKGELLLEIDPADFILQVKRAESELKSAKANLDIERANQEIADYEFRLLEESLPNPDMRRIRREPQGAILEASVKNAEVSLEQARLNLDRTKIFAPFSGVITELSIDQGGQLISGNIFGRFVGSEEFWLETNVNEDQLKWLTFSNNYSDGTKKENNNIKTDDGSRVLIYNPVASQNTFIEANLSHYSLTIDDTSRTIKLFGLIKNPFELIDINKHSLFINSYVRTVIEGKTLGEGFKIPRSLLKDKNTLWIFNSENSLEIRKIDPVYLSKDFVYLKDGILEGELIVVSQLNAPVPGMKLRHKNSEQASSDS
ncbi:MAG TPA: efflux RND transporter periplasmic adaptor subunit [Oligoflexia bacterium]|nr:efflux RND transporter periplasmic adaptor subunit [Oligoflexia bacterium]HMP47781.1 efflux RND transporter periplasmic adaptor subunit [Oligoflexia bacterium]